MTPPILGGVRGEHRSRYATRRAFRLIGLGLLATALAWGNPSFADDEEDDLMGGFDDDFDMADLDSMEDEVPGWLAALPFGEALYENVDISGSIATGGVWNYLSHTAPDGQGGTTDFGGLSRLDLDGFLQVDVQLPGEWKIRAEALAWYDFVYQIQGRRDYNGAVLDVYEWQVDTGEVYLTGPLHDNLDITIGRKVINWGRSDTFRVVDVVNPLDNKEPGLVDIEDLRRAKAMVKLDATSGPWSAQLLVIPEHRYDRQPPIGSDFVSEKSVLLGQIDGRSDFSGTPGLAGKVDGRFSGWDFSVYGAYVDDTARTPQLLSPASLRFEANKIGMLGLAGNVAFGAWLLKAESAMLWGTRSLRLDCLPESPCIESGIPGLLNSERDRIDTMVGLEWYGPDQLSVALEIVNRHLIDHPGGRTGLREITAQDNFQTALRVSRLFFRERLDITLLALALGERFQDGALFRASAVFEVTDSVKVEGGWLAFMGGPSSGLGAFNSNDRVYGEIKYSF